MRLWPLLVLVYCSLEELTYTMMGLDAQIHISCYTISPLVRIVRYRPALLFPPSTLSKTDRGCYRSRRAPPSTRFRRRLSQHSQATETQTMGCAIMARTQRFLGLYHCPYIHSFGLHFTHLMFLNPCLYSPSPRVSLSESPLFNHRVTPLRTLTLQQRHQGCPHQPAGNWAD